MVGARELLFPRRGMLPPALGALALLAGGCGTETGGGPPAGSPMPAPVAQGATGSTGSAPRAAAAASAPEAGAPLPTSSARATARPPATRAPLVTDRDRALAARLSARQLVGLRLIASFRGTARPPAALVAQIRRGEVAGVILFSENASTVAEARRLTRTLQAVPRPRALEGLPLLILVDQEGGLVRRIADAPPRRSALAAARAGSVGGIRAEGRRTGRALRRAGITVNLAPVSDVPAAGGAMLREQRTYGTSAAQVRRYAPAFARGLVAGGVQATAKHFPGFGAARVNTDDAEATVRRSAGALRQVDERAAAAVVDAGARLVMLANAVYPALDPRRPATLSRAVATGELRDRLGFDTVSITDDLQATALNRYGAPGTLAVASARAGVDLLLFGRTVDATAQAASRLQAAARDGRLPRGALRASAERVLALRRTTR